MSMIGAFKQNQKRSMILLPLLLLTFVIFSVLGQSCYAASSPGSEFKMQIRNRLEVIGSFYGVNPSDQYGNWSSLNVNYYRQAREDTLLYAELTGFGRTEGGGLLTTAGVYKDWSKTFYTHTALGTGTNSNYLPSLAIDQDFNFKFGKKNQYAWMVGGAYFNYFGNTRDLILKTGISYYKDKWAFNYQLFRNMSNPGSLESFAHQFTIDYGMEKKYWTTLEYSFGQQAYLAVTQGIPAAAVNNSSQYISLKHRRWLGPYHGIITEVNYLKLLGEYNTLGFSLGFFREF